jgi:hypothetical protein
MYQTEWNRLEPRGEKLDTRRMLAAEIHDPLWMLARQAQLGELRGEDTGSIAYIRLAYKCAPLKNVVFRAGSSAETSAPLVKERPIEQQIVSEAQDADLSTATELGQAFFRRVGAAIVDSSRAKQVKSAYLKAAPLLEPKGTTFDPVDSGSLALWQVGKGRVVDGVKVLVWARAGTIPAEVAAVLSGDEERQTLLTVCAEFAAWVAQTYGPIGSNDPAGWDPYRLNYDVQVTFGEGTTATLKVTPNEDGAVDWTSFDVMAPYSDPFANLTENVVEIAAPAHVRFPGMPAPRYWDFENSELPLADLNVQRTEIAKLLLIDLAMVYGIDWLVLPLDVPVGYVVQITSLVVCDVFGQKTLIKRAEEGNGAGDKWTMFTHEAPNGATFLVVPNSAGKALEHGPVLEQVRFARDEMANLAWGIESVTASRSGEPRRGAERDAAVDATAPAVTPPAEITAPLQYQIESKVPVHWIPMLPEQGTTRSIDLVRGAMRYSRGTVDPTGKVLRPSSVPSGAYRVCEEGIPREGTSVERVVYRSRSADGSAYLWTARRKRVGVGETESGLRFDAALPTGK